MRVAVAMSGGVDSTATALILKRSGHEVIGFHARLHPRSDQSWEMAQVAAKQIGAPIRLIDLSDQFEKLVIKHFVEEYSRGRTPSPCPLCNRFIKMTLLSNEAGKLGCEKLATGHYARIGGSPDEPVLIRGKDKKKDQSYFLFMLTRDILRRTVFPLGELTKTSVRELLRAADVSVSESDESQELCFIPQRDYREFLRKHGINDMPGPVVDSHGKTLGRHKGISNYTVGQRRGLGVCGPKPLYVLRLDPATNTLVVGPKEETLTSAFTINEINLLTSMQPSSGERFEVKIRSTSPAAPCIVGVCQGGSMQIRFETPQQGVAPGQAAVLYSGEIVVGGGWIR